MTVFHKMHGLGNDFMVLDARESAMDLSGAQICALADRHRGVGFDQLLVIYKSSGDGDAAVRFFNADGGEAGACGNGTRCVAHLLFAETGKNSLLIEGPAGPLRCERSGNAEVTADMGIPRFDWQDIPLREEVDTNAFTLPGQPDVVAALGKAAAVNVGNPHCLFFVDDVDAVDLSAIGPTVEQDPLFPERVNVGIVERLAPRTVGDPGLRLRVWERGAGITQACGSGACAAAVAAARRGLTSRTVRIELDGGCLTIDWREEDNHILMTGPATLSYRGEIDLTTLAACGNLS